jgi:hypothetical protein
LDKALAASENAVKAHPDDRPKVLHADLLGDLEDSAIERLQKTSKDKDDIRSIPNDQVYQRDKKFKDAEKTLLTRGSSRTRKAIISCWVRCTSARKNMTRQKTFKKVIR